MVLMFINTVLRPLRSQPFRSFIAACLVKDFEQRPSAIELAQHPFICGIGNTLQTKMAILIKRCIVLMDEECESSPGNEFQYRKDSFADCYDDSFDSSDYVSKLPSNEFC